MKVSFVVPVYNIEKYIDICIKSLLSQQNRDFEIILVDDGSTDKSGVICDSYAAKYHNIVVIHQKNAGVSVARNRGIEIAKGDWICFVDGDDAVSQDLLDIYSPYLNENYDVCFLRYKEIYDEKFNLYRDPKEYSDTEPWIFGRTQFEEFIRGTFNRDIKGMYDYHKIRLSMPGKFYRRSFLETNNFKFTEGIALGEDALFNLDIYNQAKKGVYVDVVTYFHRMWNDSASKKYTPDVEAKFDIFHSYLEKWIEKTGKSQIYLRLLAERKVWSLGFCCMQKYCNKKNTLKYKKRKAEFLLELEAKYKESVDLIDLRNFRLNKKILFWAMKKHNFFIINLLCVLNNLQGK